MKTNVEQLKQWSTTEWADTTADTPMTNERNGFVMKWKY